MDFALKYLSALPNYSRDLISLISGPKAFLTARAAASSDDNTWVQCLTFLGVSALISYFLKLCAKMTPLAQNGGFTDFSRFFMVLVVGLFFMICGAKLAWLVVRRNIPFNALSQTQIYIFSVASLLGNTMVVITWGLGLILFPDAYLAITNVAAHHPLAEIRGHGVSDDLQNMAKAIPLQTMMQVKLYTRATLGALIACLVGWFVLTWGTYRLQLHTSRWRSGIAFTIYLGLSVIIVALFSMTLANMRGA